MALHATPANEAFPHPDPLPEGQGDQGKYLHGNTENHMKHPAPAAQKQPNAENTYHVTHADLPVHCPMDGMTLWNSHPKVFLPVEDSGEAICPYCSAKFVLDE